MTREDYRYDQGFVSSLRSCCSVSAVRLAVTDFHMGDTLDFPTDSFDAVISVGVLTLGHAPAISLHELVRVTRPGGHILFTLRPDVYENQGFKEIQTGLESSGEWKMVG